MRQQTLKAPALEPPFDVHLFRENGSSGCVFTHPLDPSLTNHQPDSGRSHWAGQPMQVHWLDTDLAAILRTPVVHEPAARLRTLRDQHYILHKTAPPAASDQVTHELNLEKQFNHGGT